MVRPPAVAALQVAETLQAHLARLYDGVVCRTDRAVVPALADTAIVYRGGLLHDALALMATHSTPLDARRLSVAALWTKPRQPHLSECVGF